jgi:hypothetical protein
MIVLTTKPRTRIWRQVADQGNAQAQNKLGEMYLKGLWVQQNCGEALRLLVSLPIRDLLPRNTILVFYTKWASACPRTSAKHESGIAKPPSRAMATPQ